MHIYTKDIKKKAINYSYLKKRLDLNKKLQNRNFNEWLFKNIEIKKSDKILDVGCGDGAQVSEFLKIIGRKGNISCLDLNRESIEKLKKRVKFDKRVQAITSDMNNLDKLIKSSFIQKKYNIVHSSYSLYYSPNRIKVLKTMCRSLLKNGKAYVFTPCLPHGMVDIAKKFHKIPKLVEDSLKFGNQVLEKEFRKIFWEVQINYFQSELIIKNLKDFKLFYESTTYQNQKKKKKIYNYIQKKITKDGKIKFEKNGFLISGYDKRNKFF